VVPRLHGKTLRQARRALAAASCRLGGISRRRGAKKLVVRWQRPRPGRRLPAGAPVAVVLGPPARRARRARKQSGLHLITGHRPPRLPSVANPFPGLNCPAPRQSAPASPPRPTGPHRRAMPGPWSAGQVS
jgi:hypothetical protein